MCRSGHTALCKCLLLLQLPLLLLFSVIFYLEEEGEGTPLESVVFLS